MLGASFDETTRQQLQTMDALVQLAASNQELNASKLAGITGIEETQISALFAGQNPAVEIMTLLV